MRKPTYYLSTVPLKVCEFKEYKIATFLISVLDEWDLNRRMIPKETGEKCHKSIIGFPILAKLIKDPKGNPIDFGSHELKYVKQDGKYELHFSTMPIGSIVDSWIEERSLEGYKDKKSCVLVKAKLWATRFPEYFKVFDNLYSKGKIASSWEISVKKQTIVKGGKILDDIEFIGNTLLGTNILGAVPSAGVLEYSEFLECASAGNSEILLSNALIKDVYKNKEEKVLGDKKMKVASLSDKDIRSKIYESWVNKYQEDVDIFLLFPEDHTVWLRPWQYDALDTDYISVSYSIEGDELTLGDPKKCKLTVAIPDINKIFEEKNDAILEMSEKINLLSNEINELQEYKKKVIEIENLEKEKTLEQERKELEDYAISSSYITEKEIKEVEYIKNMIKNLDKSGIKSLISDRAVVSLKNRKEMASENINIDLGSLPNVGTSFSIKNYLNN
nr:MAG TPA: hypothetical protein [Caudoviricetes sp.]